MNELWFIPLIGVLGLVSTIISSTGSLYDKRYKWHKRLTSRGKIVALVGLIIVGLSIWQYVTVRKKDDKKETLQAQQRKISDSTISAEIKKGVDSILNLSKEIPIIIVKDKGITHQQKNDTTFEFTINLISTQAASNIIFVDYLCELNYSDGSSARSKISTLLNGKIRMPKDQPLTKTFEVYTNKKIKFANIALLGKYTREDGGHSMPA